MNRYEDGIRRKAMVLRIRNNPTIVNLRNHSLETVEELRGLLNRGASASLDPRRNNFYELDSGSRIFYVHVSPATGKVTFLAVWDNGFHQKPAPHQFEMASCGSAG
jgi:hypothetical protein